MPPKEQTGFNYRILVVDAEPSILKSSALVLGSSGYEVRTASDGFAALVKLRRSLPDILISDLSMPNMSGFELLSVVRRRFPQLPVIAMSGQYNGAAPNGLIADAFFSKSQYTHEQLFSRIAELLEQAPIRPNISKPDKAPVWIPKSNTGYFVVTCPECLRSFSIADERGGPEYRETECLYCGSTVSYLADLSSPKKTVEALKTGGFSNKNVSALFPENQGTKDFAHEKNTKAPEGATTGAGTGALLGGGLGWLVGIGALAIPGLGPFIAAGPIMAALAGAGVGGAVGGLTGALIGMGIPEYEAKRYEGRVKNGGILLSIHSDSSEETKRAKEILERTGAQDISSSREASGDKIGVTAKQEVA